MRRGTDPNENERMTEAQSSPLQIMTLWNENSKSMKYKGKI